MSVAEQHCEVATLSFCEESLLLSTTSQRSRTRRQLQNVTSFLLKGVVPLPSFSPCGTQCLANCLAGVLLFTLFIFCLTHAPSVSVSLSLSLSLSPSLFPFSVCLSVCPSLSLSLSLSLSIYLSISLPPPPLSLSSLLLLSRSADRVYLNWLGESVLDQLGRLTLVCTLTQSSRPSRASP